MRRLLLILLVSGAVIFTYLGLFFLSARGGGEKITVYFYRYEQLYAAGRVLPENVLPISAALQALFAGPTTEEKSNRVQTMIPAELQWRDFSIEKDILVLNLNEPLLRISGGYNVIDSMLKQIVFTATEIKGIKAVRFQISNQPEQTLIIGGEGYTIDRPLGRNYFAGEH
ncbi:MAG: GerMN domain-containing protein [Candidatus Margulisbacteria bacterium]|jgi:spore germination protein GerM|nr:GerMN domain-containing protein [Candidatus Margulisiibacteriota bacterium]